jgi:uncharacterized protein YgiM (DUF1202 family)
MMLRSFSLLCAALFASSVALAVDGGTLTRAETLRVKPFADAKAVAPAASGAKVDIVSRNGGWYQVRVAGKTGWVRMLSVRRATVASSSITGLASVASGRAGTGKVTTTTGVRGLDSEDLAAATFDEAQTKKAEGYRASRQGAIAFAKAARLSVHNVQPLPAPVQNQ